SIQTNASHFCKIMVTQFQFQDSSIQTPFVAQNSEKFFVFQSNEGAIQINGPHFCKIIPTQFQSHDGSIQTVRTYRTNRNQTGKSSLTELHRNHRVSPKSFFRRISVFSVFLGGKVFAFFAKISLVTGRLIFFSE
ncbi:hypothetical protein L0337_11645, partial [candidate division KSB1 bacterium]|nr:hypothetical protein [candidate division KSB1 bacterium]